MLIKLVHILIVRLIIRAIPSLILTLLSLVIIHILTAFTYYDITK